MASLTPEQADIYQCYLRGYAMAAGAPVLQVLSTAEEAPTAETVRTVEQDSATAVGAFDAKVSRSPRWSGEILIVVRHMKDPTLTGG